MNAAQQQALEQRAQCTDEERRRDQCEPESAARRERVADVCAEHVEARVGEVEHAEHAEDQRQSRRQHEQQQPDAHAIQQVDGEPLNERLHAQAFASGSSAARSASGNATGRRVSRSTYTCTKCPCADGFVGARAEDRHFVAHARGAELRHAQARLDALRKHDRREVVALRLDDEADRRAPFEVEHARAQQILVHDRIEVAVVHDVVHVAVDVVIRPARRDREEVRIVRALRGRWLAHRSEGFRARLVARVDMSQMEEEGHDASRAIQWACGMLGAARAACQ